MSDAALRRHPEGGDRRDAERDRAPEVERRDPPLVCRLPLADLGVHETAGHEEADAAQDVRRPHEPVVRVGVDTLLQRVERVDVEENRPNELNPGGPPVDPPRLEREQAKPASPLCRSWIRVHGLEPLQRCRRGEEDRPDEEDDAVGGRADELDEARERSDEEARRPDREQHADPPRRPPRRPPDTRARAFGPREQRVALSVRARRPRRLGSVRFPKGDMRRERPDPPAGGLGPVTGGCRIVVRVRQVRR